MTSKTQPKSTRTATTAVEATLADTTVRTAMTAVALKQAVTDHLNYSVVPM